MMRHLNRMETNSQFLLVKENPMKPLQKSLPILIMLAVILTACSPQPAVVELTPVTVQLAWTHQSQFAGMYAADQMGYFAEEGMTVSFIEGGANYDKLAPVLDGTAQFGVGGADEMLLARSEGKPLKAVATIFRLNPVVFVSLAEKNITTPQEFVGKTIRASANVAPTLNAMMANLGISPDQYTIIDAPSDLQMFTSGEIPVWGIFRNSFLVAIKDAGHKLNIVYPDDYGVHFYADSIFTTDDLISSDPDLVLRFTRATLKGWAYAIENPEEMPEMVKQYNPNANLEVELGRMYATAPLVYTGKDDIGWMNQMVWKDMEKTMREQGLIVQPLDAAQAYTLQFIEEIYGSTK
jgi:NitT/TauT family transport system substrate-binding protein